jgi:hypothetical protein
MLWRLLKVGITAERHTPSLEGAGPIVSGPVGSGSKAHAASLWVGTA